MPILRENFTPFAWDSRRQNRACKNTLSHSSKTNNSVRSNARSNVGASYAKYQSQGSRTEIDRRQYERKRRISRGGIEGHRHRISNRSHRVDCNFASGVDRLPSTRQGDGKFFAATPLALLLGYSEVGSPIQSRNFSGADGTRSSCLLPQYQRSCLAPAMFSEKPSLRTNDVTGDT
jgi:hypothetical protein